MKKNFDLVFYGYLVLPIFIFCFGFLKWYWSLIVGCILIVCIIWGHKDFKVDRFEILFQNKRMVYKAICIVVVWVLLSGIGGCAFQNYDHGTRTAIYRALVEYDWPVKSINDNSGLVYYIGFWLPAACIGKIFGFEVGYKFLYIWAVIGVILTYCLICIWRQKVDLLPILFMIFFSGLDYLGMWFLGEGLADLSEATHLEWWAVELQYSSITTQLFWVFNQAIPAWIATMLLLVQKNNRNIFFILGTLMICSTIPFVGMIPFAIYFIVINIIKDKSTWKDVFSFQNIVGILVIGGISFLYLIENHSGNIIEGENERLLIYEPTAQLIRYGIFFTFEIGIYALIVYRIYKKNFLYYFVLLNLFICPLIKVGNEHDFCMRASIPALFIFMLLCMQGLEKMREKFKRSAIVFCVFLLIGAITPFNEIHRSLSETYWRATRGESVRYPESNIESDILNANNFSGDIKDSIFFNYIAK